MSIESGSNGLFCDTIMLADGWASGVALHFSPDGTIAAVQRPARSEGLPRARGIVVPGMPNLHSHAFQFAMAGMAERAEGADQNFWSWRESMYRFAARIGPEALEAIAAQLYAEMLTRGYSSVGEFHYLHHDPAGVPYDDPSELSQRIVAAAKYTGIALTHLPVLYRYGGFGDAPPNPAQRRFVMDLDDYADLLERLAARHVNDDDVTIGMAAHSLRAVSPALLERAVDAVGNLAPTAPIHIHVAEQEQEVADCKAALGARPVEWLLDNHDICGRWCLIHATHMTEMETNRLARAGAIAGLCPTTEANLGDGVFNADRYLTSGGAIGIGSDSHVGVDPVQELRWLEYGARLSQRRRGVLATESPHVGADLYRAALAGGTRALGGGNGGLASGARADLVVLDDSHPSLLGKEHDTILDGFVFASGPGVVRDVFVGGRQVVWDGRHIHADRLRTAYVSAVRPLFD